MNASMLEVLAALFGVVGVWLTIRENIWCWPVGLVNVSAYLYIFFQEAIFGAAGLQAFYVVLLLYGWHHWLFGGPERSTLVVTRLRSNQGVPLLIGGAIASAILGWQLTSRIGSNFGYWDGATTVFSIVATWLSARKILEVWVVWVIVDLAYVGMFVHQGLYFASVNYAVYTVMAVLGFKAWKESMRASAGRQRASSHENQKPEADSNRSVDL